MERSNAPVEAPAGTCDWGWCDEEATGWRWWHVERNSGHGAWLPVCEGHSAAD